MKRSPLARRTPLRARSRRSAASPAERVWKAPQSGFCAVCKRPTWRLHRHHVLLEQTVRREGADPWALRNSMLVCQDCHANHHSGARKIPLEFVPDAAVAFAVDVLGEDRAAEYFRRRYAGADH